MGNIQTVQNRCVGCRSCEQNCPKQCISMEDNKEGFWYPTVSTDICVDCGKCLEACPAENLWVHRNQPLDVWAVRNKNVDDIMKSASGGANY